MKFWVDDIRPAPEGYVWCHSVWGAMKRLALCEDKNEFYPDKDRTVELIDMDHDAGDYWQYGGDYIELLNWLEETGRNYPIRIHSMNPVGVENMRRIIRKNNWTEVV